MLKANDNCATFEAEGIALPLPPLDMKGRVELEIYARFMRHLRLVPNSRPEIKVLSAIQFTSDIMDIDDVLVSKTLADMGLRGPRTMFPSSYLVHVDQSLMRIGFDVGGPCQSSLAMSGHWDMMNKKKPAPVRKDYVVLEEPVFS